MGLRPFSRYHLLWITALVLLASGTLLLAACGSTSSTSTSTPTATTGQTPIPTPTTSQGSTPTSTTSSGGNSVRIIDSGGTYAFSPDTLTIPKGTTVTWANTTFAPHTVTSDNNAFTGSSDISPSQTFQMTFNTAGTFTYHCEIHAYMKATIVVTA